MGKTFRFISENEQVLEKLNCTFVGPYRVDVFDFDIITPKGHIMKYKWFNYSAPSGTTVKEALTQVVLKLAPKWYYKYIDTYPVKINTLKTSGFSA
ncbi:MAG: hypothetical protein RBT74_17790 [Tenuifilaceae bacterium]|jgi:hypothetical protein|nr:hypothetical protein [Tenuifilaceae bacterium]